jgi:hypothetical protein
VFRLRKPLVIDNSSKVHWNRLEPNQILLGLENIKLMTFPEVVEGLKYLSEVKGQEAHDWNTHPWVSPAMAEVEKNLHTIKPKDIMNFYFLMKKLRYADKRFWRRMYKKIEHNICELSPNHFSYIFLTCYDSFEKLFSKKARENFNKLMESTLRSFSADGIMQVFRLYYRDKKMDSYWLENVFVTLFKDSTYVYTAKQIAEIFHYMMLLNYEVPGMLRRTTTASTSASTNRFATSTLKAWRMPKR